MKNGILKNSGASILQVVVSGVSLFIMYGLVIRYLGSHVLGIWAVVLSATAMSRMGEFGLSSALTRSVSTLQAAQQFDKRNDMLKTGAVLILAGAALVATALYFGTGYFLNTLYTGSERDLASVFLIYCTVIFFIMSVTALFQGIVEGMQRYVAFSVIHAIGSVLQLAVLAGGFQTLGAVALPFSYLVQVLFTLVAMMWYAIRLIGTDWITKGRYTSDVRKELIHFGGNIQGIFFSQYFLEFAVKAAVTYVSNASAAGIFEFASKILLRLRQVVSSALQVTMPAVASLQVRDPERLRHYYSRTVPVLRLGILFLFSMLILSTPVLSAFLNKEGQLFFITLLAGGLGVGFSSITQIEFNTVLGLGNPGPAFRSVMLQIPVFLMLAVVSWVLESPELVVVSWSVSALAGSFYLYRARQQNSEESGRFLPEKTIFPVLITMVFGVLATAVFWSSEVVPFSMTVLHSVAVLAALSWFAVLYSAKSVLLGGMGLQFSSKSGAS